MHEKETVVTMVVDGEVDSTEIKRMFGHDIKSCNTEVRDAPRQWRLGATEGSGDEGWRFIEARVEDGLWVPIGIVRYFYGDRADVYALFDRRARVPAGRVGLDPLFWINQPGHKIDGLCQTVYGSWKATIAS